MKKPSRKYLKNKLDAECSRIVRAKGRSDYSGKRDNLQDCHIFSRAQLSVRWDLDNHICLTAGEHQFWWHKNPIEATKWVRKFLGKNKYEELRLKAQQIKKWTIPEMQQLLGELKKLLLISLIFLSGCCYIKKEIYLIKTPPYFTALDMCINRLTNIRELREWIFVNEKKLYLCGGIGDQYSASCGCSKEELFDYSGDNTAYEDIFRNWFSHYTTLPQLEKKWKNKPMPEYLLTSYNQNIHQ